MSSKSEDSRINLFINTKGAEASLKNLRADARLLKNEISLLSPGTQEFIDKSKKLQEVNGRLDTLTQKVKGSGSAWEFLKGQSVGALAAMGISITAVLGMISGFISKNAALSDSMADVAKTTGMTKKEVGDLRNELAKIDTRTSVEGLLKIATVAGQLGIAKKDVLAFTIAVDKLNVALGDEFKGGPEEITKELGGLRNIFQDIKSDKIDQDILKIGNALNVLGAEGAATGPVVADFANRIGGVAIPLGLTTGQVLGLSATLQELNVTSERGGTATVKILQRMLTDVKGFASVAGMDVKQFKDLLNNDLFGAFMKVVEGAKKSGQSGTAFAKILKELDVDGSGVSEVMGKLGTNTDLLRQKVDLSNKSLTNTNSIMAEFATKNATFGANMEKGWKFLTEKFVNSDVVKFFTTLSSSMTSMIPAAESAQQSLRGVLAGFNQEIEILKTANFSQEQRARLIGEINSKYGEYLPNLLSEKASLEDIEAAQKAVNDTILSKILYMDYEKELTEIYKKQKESAESLYQVEKQRASKKMSTGDHEGLTKDQQDMLDKLNKNMIKNTDNTVKEVEDKYNKMADQIGLSFQKIKNATAPGGGKSEKGKIVDNSPVAEDKEFINLKKRWEKMAEMAHRGYEDQLRENLEFDEKQDHIAKEKEAKDTQAKVKELHDELDFREQMRMLEMTDTDATIEATKIRYAKLINQAEQYGMDITGLVKLEEFEIAAIKKAAATKEFNAQKATDQKELQLKARNYSAQSTMLNDFAGLVSATNAFIGESGEDLTEFQKGIVLTQIALQTAAAIASNIAGATAAAAETPAGPLYAVQVAGYIAAGLTSILTGAAQAKAVLKGSENNKVTSTGNIPKSRTFAEGGHTGSGMGEPDHTGLRVAGVVHENEYVINPSMMRDPYVINQVRIFEAMRRGGFAEGGYTNTPTPTFDIPNVTDAMKMGAGSTGDLHEILNRIYTVLNESKDKRAVLSFEHLTETEKTASTLTSDSSFQKSK